MQLELIDLKNLPKTSIVDGTPIYTNPILVIKNLFLKRLKLCLEFLKLDKGTILDVGCGSGILLPTLSKINGMIVGLDVHKYLPKVKDYLKKNNFKTVHLIRADSHHLPFKEATFDSLLIISLLDHLQSPKMAINELFRVTKWKGKIIFGFHVENLISTISFLIWALIFVASHLIIFRNFREVISYFFRPNTWHHFYSDLLLIQWVSEKFKIKELNYLRAINPVYVGFESIKEKD